MFILGVDPGTNYCGVAIFEIDDRTLAIKNIRPLTLDYTKSRVSHIPNILIDRLSRLYNDIVDICKDYDLYWLAIEAGYISKLQPTAYGPLSKCIYTVESAFINVTNTFNITEYSPSIMKAVMGTESNHKDDMLKAVSQNSELKPYIKDQTEHAIDAMAIGYTKLLDMRLYPACNFNNIF